jgi:hypothetical protein
MSTRKKGNPMTEDLLTKNPMDEDLLTKIQRETHERLRELRAAVDEHDRLAGELRALDAAPEPPADLEPPVAREAVPEPRVVPEPHVDTEPSVDPEPLTNVVRFPTRHEPERTAAVSPQAARPMSPTSRPARGHVVSPKVARLMHAPRRPALERAGVVRVGAARLDCTPEEPVEEVDVEAEVYERSI